MRLIWTAQARTQLQAAWVFLADRSPEYADRVEGRLLVRARSIVAAPLQGREIPGTRLRALSLPDVQYVIHYRADEDAIRIMDVFSTRQNRDGQ